MKQGFTEAWSIDIGEGVIFTNKKSQKTHRYIFAKLILGFNLQMKHFDVKSEPPIEEDLEIQDTTVH